MGCHFPTPVLPGSLTLIRWRRSTSIWSEEYSESSIVYGEASFSRLRRQQAHETSLWEVPLTRLLGITVRARCIADRMTSCSAKRTGRR